MIPPRAVPDAMPPEIPAAGPAAPLEGEATADGAGVGGRPGGVVGGVPGAVETPADAAHPPPPIEARPHDLAAVRAGIARTLVYPPNARRNGVQGRVLVEFVLLADGWIRGLALRSSSGFPLLDSAALAAVEKAAPFPPPGVDVRVVAPVVFRAE
jgi:protein TonB